MRFYPSVGVRRRTDNQLIENLALFSQILAYVKQTHLDTPDSKELMEGAINGMLRKLDPYSQFIPDYTEFQTQIPR